MPPPRSSLRTSHDVPKQARERGADAANGVAAAGASRVAREARSSADEMCLARGFLKTESLEPSRRGLSRGSSRRGARDVPRRVSARAARPSGRALAGGARRRRGTSRGTPRAARLPRLLARRCCFRSHTVRPRGDHQAGRANRASFTFTRDRRAFLKTTFAKTKNRRRPTTVSPTLTSRPRVDAPKKQKQKRLLSSESTPRAGAGDR